MIKKLKLFNKYAKFDDKIFIPTTEENLVVQVDNLRKSITYYVVIFNDTFKSDNILIESNEFIVENKFFETYGEIHFKIIPVINGEVLQERGIPCESIIVKELNKQPILIPEIENLKGELFKYKKEATEKMEELKKQIAEIKAVEGGNYD